MRELNFNAAGIGGPEDGDESLSDRIYELMESGMSRDEAYAKAVREADARADAALFDRGEDLYEGRFDVNY